MERSDMRDSQSGELSALEAALGFFEGVRFSV